MKKTIVRALAVMAVSVTAIALFGCKNGLGSTVLAEAIKSEEGPKDPVVSTEGMFGDFDKNATVDGVALSDYADDLKYDWPDITESGEYNWMEVGLSGTIKFHEDGYYVPFILGDGYEALWEHDKKDGNIYLAKVEPLAANWNGIWAGASKNGVEIKFIIRCTNLQFDTSADARSFVDCGSDASLFLEEGGSANVDNDIAGKTVSISISGGLRSMTADDVKYRYNYDEKEKDDYVFYDGYYLPVTFREDYRWGWKESPTTASYYKFEGEKGALLYLGTDSADTDTEATYVITFTETGGWMDMNDVYTVNLTVSVSNGDSDGPGTGTPEPDEPDEEDGEGNGGDQNLNDQTLMSAVEQTAIQLRRNAGEVYIKSIQFRQHILVL